MTKEKKMLIWKICICSWIVLMLLSAIFPIVKTSKFSSLAEEKSKEIGTKLLSMHMSYFSNCKSKEYLKLSVRKEFDQALLADTESYYYDFWSGKTVYVNQKTALNLCTIEIENQIEFSVELQKMIEDDVTTVSCAQKIVEINNNLAQEIILYNKYVENVVSQLSGVYKYFIPLVVENTHFSKISKLYLLDITMEDDRYTIKRKDL